MSKMTVINEIADRDQYFQMKFVEYMELLCRISTLIFSSESKYLFRQVEHLLDILLRTIGEKVEVREEGNLKHLSSNQS